MAEIDALFRMLVEADGSDLHISAGRRPMIRESGEMKSLDLPVIENSDMEHFIAEIIPETNQQEFMEHGEMGMKPLILKDIAETIEVHESTVSRATTRKYMLTPRGLFELKYFFSSHVATTAGGECSSTAIRALIRKLVAAESPRKPLSDNKIAQLLEGQGIQVARRTIAKYRDTLMIPPSNERKRLV